MFATSGFVKRIRNVSLSVCIKHSWGYVERTVACNYSYVTTVELLSRASSPKSCTCEYLASINLEVRLPEADVTDKLPQDVEHLRPVTDLKNQGLVTVNNILEKASFRESDSDSADLIGRRPRAVRISKSSRTEGSTEVTVSTPAITKENDLARLTAAATQLADTVCKTCSDERAAGLGEAGALKLEQEIVWVTSQVPDSLVAQTVLNTGEINSLLGADDGSDDSDKLLLQVEVFDTEGGASVDGEANVGVAAFDSSDLTDGRSDGSSTARKFN